MEDGTHRAKALDWGLGRTTGGSEQIAVTFATLDASGAPGETITWYGYFTDKAIERTVETLRVCGWEGDDLSDLTGTDRNEVSIVVESETWEGRTRQKVKWVNAMGGGSVALREQLTPTEAKQFANRMRGTILALKQKEGAPKRAEPRVPRFNGNLNSRTGGVISPEPPPHTEDDLPF